MTAPMLILAGKTFSRGAIAELRPWTDEEIERLRELRARGLSRADCGEKLGRSEGGVWITVPPQKVTGHSPMGLPVAWWTSHGGLYCFAPVGGS